VPSRAPSFVVISGAKDGAFYVRQLLRAASAGRLALGRVHVVDRDPDCLAARARDPRVELHVAEWGAWLDERLAHFRAEDHFVPYHWAPHLLRDWLERQGARVGRTLERGGSLQPLGLPFEGDTREGSRALSYAAWTCPPTCIEPALCPHTRGARDWSLAADLQARRAGAPEPLVFQCLHLAYGVGTIPMWTILAAAARVRAAAPGQQFLVGTASHCHGLAATLAVATSAPRLAS
jgi:hypothetical protein